MTADQDRQAGDDRLIVLVCGWYVYLFRGDQTDLADAQHMILDVAYPATEVDRYRQTRDQVEETVRQVRADGHRVEIIDVTG